MDRGREDEKQMSAVMRTISILEALSEVEGINLEALSKKTELPKATLLRFLSTLISQGYVYRDGADMYHLTLKMFSVGSRSLRHMDLINTAKPFAKELCEAADILSGKSTGNGYFTLSTYPASQPLMMEIVKNGVAAKLIEAGALIKPAFCGPCFGAGLKVFDLK